MMVVDGEDSESIYFTLKIKEDIQYYSVLCIELMFNGIK